MRVRAVVDQVRTRRACESRTRAITDTFSSSFCSLARSFAPYLDASPLVQLGLTMFLWNLDSWDWQANSTLSMERLRGAMATPNTWVWANPAAGSYEVLGHDIHRVTVESFVVDMVAETKRQGWTFTNPSDASCHATTRWIEGGEDVYEREKTRAPGLAAAAIAVLPVPADYESLGAAPPPEASNFGKPSQTGNVIVPTNTGDAIRPTGDVARPTGVDDGSKPGPTGNAKPVTVDPSSSASELAAGAIVALVAAANALFLA